MKRNNRIRFAATLLALSLFWLFPSMKGQVPGNQKVAAAQADHKAGIIVEEVTKSSEAEKAGLQEGDVLLRWIRGDAKGEIESPFDIAWIEIEQTQRGVVTLEGSRANQKRLWTLETGNWNWGLKARPNFPRNLLSIYKEGQELRQAGKLMQAAERWRAAAGHLDSSAPPWMSLWLLSSAASSLAEAQQWKQADSTFEQAIVQAAGTGRAVKGHILRIWAKTFQPRGDWASEEKYYQQAAEQYQNPDSPTLIFADSLDGLAISAFNRNDLDKAERYYSQALAIQQKLAPGSIGVSLSLAGLGNLARARGDLARAEEYLRQALAIDEKLVPNNRDVAADLSNLGTIARNRGDLPKSEEYLHQALALQEKLDPESLNRASMLSSLGITAWYRGDLAQAAEYQNQALAIQQKLAPDGIEVSRTLINLGIVFRSRGDLVKAEECYRQALVIEEKVVPGTLDVATNINNLGEVARDRGDLTNAEEYYRQALDMKNKLAPDSLSVAMGLNHLGEVARDRGDLTKAEEYYRQALPIEEKLAPNSLLAADSLNGMGLLAEDRGDLSKSHELHQQALAIREKFAPGSLTVAASLTALGDVDRIRGDLEKAEEYYRKSLAIQEKLAPESAARAETLADLAGVMLRKQQLDAAAPLSEQGLNALESQISHLGGSEEVRSGFRAKHLSYYRDYIDLLMRFHDQRPAEGFSARALEASERARARGLLDLLNESHVDIRQGVEPALLDQERFLQTSLNAKAAYRIRLLTRPHTAQEASNLEKEISALTAAWETTEAEIRARSPRYAALTQPRPLRLSEIQRLLDPKTLLLEYSLGDDRSFMWAVTPGSLVSFELPKRSEVETAARRAYEEVSANHLPARSQATKALSRMLLAPLAGQLGSKRLVIVAEGALQYIPFSALQGPRGVPLIAEHEIVTLPSASTLAILREEMEGHSPASMQLAVLADPVFSPDDPRVSRTSQTNLRISSSDKLERSAKETGLATLDRLPASRREANAIVALAGERASKKALDFDANLETATSPELSQFRIVHFASHALLNSQHPELSGIILSLVDRQGHPQDGFLQAHQIYNLKLNADLVVLSACQTALGKEVQGEGLIGLTRGFMYAGAPRIVASLWQVPDLATMELMRRFYSGILRQGLPPAAALRAAQAAMRKEQRWRAPYYWAGFTLQGEWK